MGTLLLQVGTDQRGELITVKQTFSEDKLKIVWSFLLFAVSLHRFFLTNYNLQSNFTSMKKYVIGDRLKDEWISVLDTEKKKLEFTNHLASAKEIYDEEVARKDLKKLQETGYFSDLQIYLKEDNKAYKPDERDSFQV